MTDWTQGDMFTGDGPFRAADGMQRVLDHQGEDWAEVTRANVIHFLRSHPTYCADDLWRYQLMPYQPHHPNAIGALTRGLITAGYIAEVGSMLSKRDDAQSRRIIVYRSTIFRRQH